MRQSTQNIHIQDKLLVSLKYSFLNYRMNSLDDNGQPVVKDTMDFHNSQEISDFMQHMNSPSFYYYFEVEMDKDQIYQPEDIKNRLGPKISRLYKSASDPIASYCAKGSIFIASVAFLIRNFCRLRTLPISNFL